MDCVIFGNGEFKDCSLLEKYVDVNEAFVIGVDGGCNHLIENNIKIDLIIGDFDSLKYKNVIYNNRHILKTNMDYNDLEIAMKYCFDKGFKKIYLFGFTGKRSDHFMFNLRVMQKFTELGLKIIMIDEYHVIKMFKGNVIFPQEDFKFFSLLPVYEDTIISISGSEYDVDNLKLNMVDTTTLSNSFRLKEIKISSNKLIFIYLVF